MNKADKEHFDTHGWVLLPEVIPTAEIDAILPALYEVYPSPELFHSGTPSPLSEPFRQHIESDKSAEGGAFRPLQFAGLLELPFAKIGLDTLPLHHTILDLADEFLQTEDIRLYQAEMFAKYTGVINYQQAWHVDYTNHMMLPPDKARGYNQIHMFLFLSDVTEALGATQIVSRTYTENIPLMNFAFPAGSKPDITDEQLQALDSNAQPAVGKRGSILIYAADVVHRATEMTEPDGARFLYILSFKAANMDWIGGNPWPRKGVHDWAPFIETLDPRQLQALGYPPPGHPYWTKDTLSETANRYPKLDLTAYKAALV